MPRGKPRSNLATLVLAAIAATTAAASTPGCGGPSIGLIGGDDGGGSDDGEGPDGDGEAESDDNGEPGDAPEEVGTSCPLWAASSGPAGAHRGSSDDPMVGFAAALDMRGACEYIVLVSRPGDPPFDLAADILLSSGERLVVEGDPGGAERPILDGQGGSSGLRVAGEARLELRRLHVRNVAAAEGACLHAEVQELLLDETLWEGCAAEADGGAIFANVGSLTVSESSFRSNSAGGSGGALFIDGPTDTARAEIERCTFERNAADAGGGLYLAMPSTDVRVSGSRFTGNTAVQLGSAIGGRVGVEIVGNRFEGNEGGVRGGAVAGSGAWAGGRIVHNVFTGNRVRVDEFTGLESGGAALFLNSAYALVANNLFVDNRTEVAPDLGSGGGIGAVRLVEGRGRLRNNTFVDNSAERGAAHLHVINGEVAGNLLVGGVGALSASVYAVAGGSAVEMYNDSWEVPEPAFSDGVGTIVGEGDLRLDPMFVDAPGGDFRLTGGSPCVDAGDPADEWRDPDGSRNDIGAFGGPEADWVPLGPGDGP